MLESKAQLQPWENTGTIYQFVLLGKRYHHGINTETDNVYLTQVLDNGSRIPLLEYTNDSKVFELSEDGTRTKHIADFSLRLVKTEGESYWHCTRKDGKVTVGHSLNDADGLLKDERDFSMEWIKDNLGKPKRRAVTAMQMIAAVVPQPLLNTILDDSKPAKAPKKTTEQDLQRLQQARLKRAQRAAKRLKSHHDQR